MSTLATPIRRRSQLDDPSCVKVVFNQSGEALYFSRSPIPHAREWDDELLAPSRPHFFQHVGPVRLPPRVPAGNCASCHLRRSNNWRAWSNCGCCRPATPSWSSVIDEPTIGIDTSGGLPGICQPHVELLTYGSGVRCPGVPQSERHSGSATPSVIPLRRRFAQAEPWWRCQEYRSAIVARRVESR